MLEFEREQNASDERKALQLVAQINDKVVESTRQQQEYE